MEFCDILDENGNKTGRTIQRGQPRSESDFILAVHVYLCNAKGEFLLEKRSMKKRAWPGVWDIIGGVVMSGEDSISCAIRETEEEVGIKLLRDELKFLKRIKRGNFFVDIYIAKKDFSITECVLQEEEVDEVKFAGGEDMVDIVFSGEFFDEEYKRLIEDYIASPQFSLITGENGNNA